VILSLVFISCPEDEIDDTSEHTVTFKDGYTVIIAVQVAPDTPFSSVPKPSPNPTRSGYTFKGWSSTNNDNGNVENNSAFTGNITSDTTVYAIWGDYTPQFWWGNYIPATANNAGLMTSNFDIEELVRERANARDILTLVAGTPPPMPPPMVPGPPWATEIKGNEAAIKTNKSITWTTNHIGFRFFIYPKSYGLLSGITMVGPNDPMIGEYTQVERKIDEHDYFIYYTHNVLTSVSSDAIHRFEFN